MDRIETFLDGLPGYSGYRDKERRRDTDRRLRESIANQLESIAQRVERGGASLVAQRQLDAVSGIESLVRQLNHAGNLVRTQRYGYGGIFSDTPVDERALNQLYLFDKGLGMKVSQLDSQLSSIEADLAHGGSVQETLQRASGAVQGIIDHLAARNAVVETASPAASRSLFTPLDEETEAPSQPIDIAVGDAIAWFDEDFLVDAIIDVSDGVHRVRFLHLEHEPDRWLCIADRGEQLIALLTENQSGSDTGSVAWTLAGSGRTIRAGGSSIKADALVTCYEEGEDNVAFRLVSGADERYLAGHRVHPDDLSIYGKPSTK
ncbi:MAG: hypothetical protein AB7G88_00125 [Thermomicrobiales bacterium]